MSTSTMTYGQLDNMLKALGFAVRATKDNGRRYEHPAGAQLSYPDLPPHDRVMPHHLVMTRTQLDWNGFPEPDELSVAMGRMTRPRTGPPPLPPSPPPNMIAASRGTAMPPPVPLPRKQRTREHVIADLSVNHVERFVLEAGYTVEEMSIDYGFDLMMTTFDDAGCVDAGHVFIQLKASDAWAQQGDGIPFDLDVRDYNLWVRMDPPVILILYDYSRRKAFWVCVQRYFRETQRQPRPGAKTVRILVPVKQTVSRRGMVAMRALRGGRLRLVWED